MKILREEPLSQYTTFHMGGICKELLIPETEAELISLVQDKQYNGRLIGGGSNMLINDCECFDRVILLKNFNEKIVAIEKGVYEVGASFRLQKLIKTVNEQGYGGIEYLYSVPGLIGGAIYMNAGRGSSHKDNIGQHVVSVKAIVDNQIRVFTAEECQFEHRKSIFQKNKAVILSAVLSFDKGEPERFSQARKDRIEHVKAVQDAAKPNFGSVFCESNGKIMKFVQIFMRGKAKVHYSRKTANWMLNEGGCFSDAVELIENVKKLHRLCGQKCRTEVTVWK